MSEIDSLYEPQYGYAGGPVSGYRGWEPESWPHPTPTPCGPYTPPQIGRIDLGPTREEVDALRRRIEQIEQLEQERQSTRPARVLRAEDI